MWFDSTSVTDLASLRNVLSNALKYYAKKDIHPSIVHINQDKFIELFGRIDYGVNLLLPDEMEIKVYQNCFILQKSYHFVLI